MSHTKSIVSLGLQRRSDGRRHGRGEVVVERGLDRVPAPRLHLVRVQIVRANVLQLAQVRVKVLLRGRGGRFGLVGGFDVVAENGDDVAAEVFVVRAEAACGPTCAAPTAANVLELLKKCLVIVTPNLVAST